MKRKVKYAVICCIVLLLCIIFTITVHNPKETVEAPVDIPVSENVRISPYYYHEVGLVDVDLSRYDEFLAADKGVIPVKKDGLWGLVSYDGEELLSPVFAKCYRTPNEDGYAVFQDGADRFYITARTGDIIYKANPSVIDLRITMYNIIYSRHRLEGEEHKYLYQYETLDGNMIYQAYGDSEECSYKEMCFGTLFREGENTKYLGFDGTIIDHGNLGPYTPLLGTSNDFYLASKDTEPGMYAVISRSDKEAILEFTLEELVGPYYDEWGEVLQSAELVPYDFRGATCWHMEYARFCVKATNNKGEEKYFLFDGYEWTENRKYECICEGVYDYVEFLSGETGGVWLVKENDDYYYIRVYDHEKVLGPYDDATMFWYTHGIALEGRKAQVIDWTYEVAETISGVRDMIPCNEVVILNIKGKYMPYILDEY